MHALIEHFQAHCADLAADRLRLVGDQAGGTVHAPLLGHRDNRPGEMDRGLEAHRQGQPRAGTGSISGTTAALSSTGAARARLSLHGAPECASNAASVTSGQRSSSRFCSPACRQRAYHKRLSVTLSVTPAPAPNAPIEPSDTSEVFRYVRHADVPRFTAEGWELLPALDGTHHGEYSVLMRRGRP